MKKSTYAIFAIFLALFTSCEKEIEFKYKDIPPQRVIEGLLTQDGVSIRISNTVATDEPFTNQTISYADVSIDDLTSGTRYILNPDDSGDYSLSEFQGNTGHEYSLTVKIGEDTYTSQSKMLLPSEILSAGFYWIAMPYDDVAVLKVKFTALDDSSTCYWLRVYRNGEPYDWQSIESRNVVDGIATGMMMTSRKNTDEEDDETVLKDGDIIDIEVMPISKAMGDYLNSLNNGDYNGNRMFDGPYCLGYFLAAPISKTQIIYQQKDILWQDD